MADAAPAVPASALAPAVLDRLRAIAGDDGVLATPLARRAYARDLWPLGHLAFASTGLDLPAPFRDPDAVVRPRSTAEVSQVIRLANEHGFAVVPWGAGSGVCGGTVAVRGGVALDLKRLDRIVSIDGKPTRYLPLDQARKKIQAAGPKGVQLVIHRDLKVTRE